MVMHPVGPLPATTYWRRRLVLLAVLVGVLLLLRGLLGGGGGGSTPSASHGTPTPAPSPTRSATPAPSAATTPTACRDGALQLTVAAPPGQLRAGSPVRFTVTVRNTSSTACRRDLGGGALEVVIRSGPDRIWSSDDCSTDRGRSVQLLKAGASLETSVSWPGTRSARGCPTPQSGARPGTYTVRARLATLRSDAAVFRLTG